MAVEVKKVLDNLKTKLKGKSISTTFLNKAATRYAEKIEADADIDEFVNERLDDIIDAGVEADRRVTAALKKPTTNEPNKDKTPVEEIDEDELKDAPAYVKAMMKQMQGMSEQIVGFQKEKEAQTIASRFSGHEKLKNIPAKLIKGRIPSAIKDDEELEALVNEVYEDLKEFETGGSNGGGANGSRSDRPRFGGGDSVNGVKKGEGGEGKPTDAVKTFTEQLNKQNSVNKN